MPRVVFPVPRDVLLRASGNLSSALGCVSYDVKVQDEKAIWYLIGHTVCWGLTIWTVGGRTVDKARKVVRCQGRTAASAKVVRQL